MQKNKPYRPDPSIRYICLTILWIALIILLGAMFITGMNNRGELEVDCDFGEIEYGVSNRTSCWMDGVAPEYCPLPTEIHCKIKIGMNSYSLGKFLLSLD